MSLIVYDLGKHWPEAYYYGNLWLKRNWTDAEANIRLGIGAPATNYHLNRTKIESYTDKPFVASISLMHFELNELHTENEVVLQN